jgi:hypothetical protein
MSSDRIELLFSEVKVFSIVLLSNKVLTLEQLANNC